MIASSRTSSKVLRPQVPSGGFELVLAQHVDRLFRDRGWLHRRHRVALDFAFVFQEPEEAWSAR
jgi:hypothetical protein